PSLGTKRPPAPLQSEVHREQRSACPSSAQASPARPHTTPPSLRRLAYVAWHTQSLCPRSPKALAAPGRLFAAHFRFLACAGECPYSPVAVPGSDIRALMTPSPLPGHFLSSITWIILG